MGIDTYLANVVVGNEQPGAPLLHIAALVVVPSGLISGHAEITQALPPPHRNPQITDLRGRLYSFEFKEGLRVATLTGTYVQSFPPPAIGEIVESFSAVLALDTGVWEGRGSFAYGGNGVHDVPVTPEH
jgi:hypothetical protein